MQTIKFHNNTVISNSSSYTWHFTNNYFTDNMFTVMCLNFNMYLLNTFKQPLIDTSHSTVEFIEPRNLMTKL